MCQQPLEGQASLLLRFGVSAAPICSLLGLEAPCPAGDLLSPSGQAGNEHPGAPIPPERDRPRYYIVNYELLNDFYLFRLQDEKKQPQTPSGMRQNSP